MRVCLVLTALLSVPVLAAAQQPAAVDSAMHQHGDTLTRTPVQLQEITITNRPARREEPQSAVRVTAQQLRTTPAPNTYQLLRQTAGLEVHDQGQGPGFASDASVRGFSSDHSTDLALWIDGVPINEPVNGHAEGYNDWYLLFPDGISQIDVLKGPTSALFGNFALAGVVNVRTLERMTGSDVWLSGGSWGRVEGTGLPAGVMTAPAECSASMGCGKTAGAPTVARGWGRDTPGMSVSSPTGWRWMRAPSCTVPAGIRRGS